VKIVAIKDGQKPSEYSYDPELNSNRDVWVGRGDDCQIVIRDPKVSRLIGRFNWKDGQLFFITETVPQATIQLWPGVPFIWQGIQFLIEGMPNSINSKSKKNIEIDSDQTKVLSGSAPISNDSLGPSFGEEDIQLDTPMMMQETMNESSNSSFSGSSGEGNAAENIIFDSNHENHELQEVSADATTPNNELANNTKTQFIPQFLQYVLKCEGKGIPYEHFFLDQEEILIGSDSKCQFRVNDIDFPLVAARLRREGGIYSITSEGQGAELIVNGKVVNKAMLNDGLRFMVGSIRFDVVVQSEILHHENEALMPVEHIDASDDESTELLANSKQSAKSSDAVEAKDKKRKYQFNLKEIWSNPKRRIMLYVIVLGLVFVLLDDETTEVSDPTPGEKDAPVASAENKSQNEMTDFSKGQKKVDATAPVATVSADATENVRVYSPEEKDYLNSHYQLAVSYIEKGDYLSALNEIDLVRSLDDKYKDVQLISNLAKDGLKKIEEEEKRKKELEEKLIREGKVKELVAKAQDALRNDELTTAENIIGMVVEIDPENQDVYNLKQEIEARREDLRLKEEQLKLKADRRSRLMEQLIPGKSYYIQKEWYKAILKLNEFLLIKDNDEDLITEASEMLAQSNKEMGLEIDPLLLAARSAKSKEDLKDAYENYSKVLKINPGQDEAVTETKDLKEILNEKARKVFREAMYKESINLYIKAREKFQEVLLIAPSDSEYYQRAEARLKKLYVD
jgi:tetratricopeptide (TPR) repeat protein